MTQTITAQEAAKWLANGEALLIDVREPDEFKSGHIPYAMSVPLAKVEETLKKLELPKDKKIIFQCLKGTRGAMACANAMSAGCCASAPYNIEGGIGAWQEAGLPIVRAGQSAGGKISIFRQVQIIVGGLIALMVLLGFGGWGTGYVIAGLLGAALMIAGLTGFCGLAFLLARMPWNK